MDWTGEWKPLALIGGLFAPFYLLPVGLPRFDGAVLKTSHLAHW
ncbi:MAG: hypothetical protein AB1505_03320 [Candidatus Latescibacterota bacterium]